MKGTPGRSIKQSWAFNAYFIEILVIVVLFISSRRKLQKPLYKEWTLGAQLPIALSPGMGCTCCVAFRQPCNISVPFPRWC